MKPLIVTMSLIGIALAAQPAQASPLAACRAGDISSTMSPFTDFAMTSCQGFDAGNLLNNKSSNVTAQIADVNGLLDAAGLGAYDFTKNTFNFGSLPAATYSKSSNSISFPDPLSGMTLIGIHYGKGNSSNGPGGEATEFLLFNAGTDLSKIYLYYGTFSNAVLYGTDLRAVPEPASWAMMLTGMGAIGFAMRRRAKVRVSHAGMA